MIGRILVALCALAAVSFVLLVLIGLWSRYEQQIQAFSFHGIYERYFAIDPKIYTGAETEHPRRAVISNEQRAPVQLLQQAPQVSKQVPKLVGTGAIGITNQGMSVAVSADGNTAVVGGPGPNNADRDRSPMLGPVGAAWVFRRRGDIWTQEGNKLVGSTSEYGGGLWSQGASVALSADGNTALVGGPSDNKTTGAAWVFTRSAGGWIQQGKKLVGTGAHRADEPALSLGQGLSVALSADGNTAIVGGWRTEGAWLFTRRDGVWTQQGDKVVGSGALGNARQGMSVALSADGKTAILGGPSDNNNIGAAWVFTRNARGWTQDGKKLVGGGAEGSARQGVSVALSADGNTAIIGGPGDNPSDRSRPFGAGPAGAAWVFTRSGGVWTQQGNKLTSSEAVGIARQGTSVALSADGNTAVVARMADGVGPSAVSVFTRSEGHWIEDKDLAPIGAVGKSTSSIALSADGSLVVVGGIDDDGGVGAAWVITPQRHSGSDFD